jgi:transcriptional regulator with XRE-family HTH domain
MSGFLGAGEKIRGLRTHKGMTLQEVADILSTSKSNVCHIEKNHRPLTFDMIRKLSIAFRAQEEAVLLLCLQSRYPRLLEGTTLIELDKISHLL